jgi:hypothetical protein
MQKLEKFSVQSKKSSTVSWQAKELLLKIFIAASRYSGFYQVDIGIEDEDLG